MRRTAIVEVDLKGLLGGGLKLVERFGDEAYFVALCIRSGLVRPELPHRVAQMLLAFERFGLLAGAVTIGAIRHGDRVALRDERGDVTYKELDERSNALANAWRERGLEPGDGVAILARNHRGFLDAVFAARQVRRQDHPAQHLVRRSADPRGGRARGHRPARLRRRVRRRCSRASTPRMGRFRAWTEDDAEDGDETLDVADRGRARPTRRPSPSNGPKIVILTSGTTGTPKGAPRSEPQSLSMIGGLLSKVPFRARETTELCVPMFHALGFALDGARAGARLDAGRAPPLRPRGRRSTASRRTRPRALIVVPVMLQRILDLGEDKISGARPVLAEDHLHRRLAARRRAGQARPEGVRPGPLQPLRLDRGRLRDDRHARATSTRSRPRSAASSAERSSRSSTTTARRSSRARPAGSSSATPASSRATPAARPRSRSRA